MCLLCNYWIWHLNIESLCQSLFNSFCLVFGGPIHKTPLLLEVKELFNATEQNHFEKLVVSQLVKFPGFYGTQSVHYCLHKSPPLVLILSKLSPVHVIPASFFMIHFNIPSSVPGFYNWSVRFGFPHQNFACIFSSPSSGVIMFVIWILFFLASMKLLFFLSSASCFLFSWLIFYVLLLLIH